MGVTIKQREKSGYSVQSQAIMTYKRWIEKGQLPSEAGRGQAESVFFSFYQASVRASRSDCIDEEYNQPCLFDRMQHRKSSSSHAIPALLYHQLQNSP